VNSVPSQLNIEFTYTGFTTPLPLPRLATALSNCNSAGTCKAGIKLETQIPSGSSIVSSKKSTTTSQNPSGTVKPQEGSKTSIAGPVAGGVVGGLAVIAAAVVAIFWFRSRQRRKATSTSVTASDSRPLGNESGGVVETVVDSIPGQQKAELPTYERTSMKMEREPVEPVELEQRAPLMEAPLELEANEHR